MEQGRIIFLNGVTSSGKTSIVEAMQVHLDPFFYVVANDLFENTIGDTHLQSDYWKYLSEAIIVMYHTAKLFSDRGRHVLIDGILADWPGLKPHYEQVQAIFDGYPLDIIELYCPLEICRQRNIDRGDRGENQSEEQHRLMSANIKYSFSVDTSKHAPEECADLIIASIFK